MASSKKHYSAMQKKVLLEFIEENPSLVKLKISNQYTSSDMRKKWEEVTEKLNAIPGVKKNWKDWRKSWSDIKCRTKKKQCQNNKSATITGGGPSSHEEIDPIENRILNVIGGNTMIMGNIGIAEAGIIIETEDNCITEHSSSPLEENNNNSKILDDNIPHQNDEDYAALKTDNIPHQNDEDYAVLQTTQTSQISKMAVPPPKKTRGADSARPLKKTNLKASIEAFNNLITIAKEKNEMRRSYYQEKLKILKEYVEAQKTIANSLKNIEGLLLECMRGNNS